MKRKENPNTYRGEKLRKVMLDVTLSLLLTNSNDYQLQPQNEKATPPFTSFRNQALIPAPPASITQAPTPTSSSLPAPTSHKPFAHLSTKGAFWLRILINRQFILPSNICPLKFIPVSYLVLSLSSFLIL
jgi:hypothetical protein